MMESPNAFTGFVGTSRQLVDHVAAYVDAGAQEVIFEWFGMDDVDALEMIAAEVSPMVRGRT